MIWTSCEDKMPPEKVRVLCVTKRHGIRILMLWVMGTGAYKPGATDWQGDAVSNIIPRLHFEDVTHWMELPSIAGLREPATRFVYSDGDQPYPVGDPRRTLWNAAPEPDRMPRSETPNLK